MANGTLKVSNIQTSSGSGTITIGQSGETVTIPSGVTMTGMGKVLQVVSATDSTSRTISSSYTFITGGNTLSVNITPASTSSKILLLYTSGGYSVTSTKEGRFTIFRDGTTNLGNGTNGMNLINQPYPTPISGSYLDSPNTISQINYQVYALSEASQIVYLNHGNVTASLTAIEIAG